MVITRNIIITIILCVSSVSLHPQNLKEVKTAQDIVDNFITANGGVENLKKIKSIKATGSLTGKEKENEYFSYVSEEAYYDSFKSKEMDVFEAYDAVNNKSWISLRSI